MANQQYAHKFELGVPFHTYLEDYAPKWEELAWLRRDENGILEVQLHWGEGPCKFSESVHSGPPRMNVSSSPAPAQIF